MNRIKTRAFTKDNLTIWPYLWKDEPAYLITRRVVQEADPNHGADKCETSVELVNPEGKLIEVTDKEKISIMTFILWWEGRDQVEEVKLSYPDFNPKDRWLKILNE